MGNNTLKQIGIEIAKGIGLAVMGGYVQESIGNVSRGKASDIDKALAQAFYDKLNEKRLLGIETQLQYHRGRIRHLTAEKNKLLPPPPPKIKFLKIKP